MTFFGSSSDHVRVLIASDTDHPRLGRAFARWGHQADLIPIDAAAKAVDERTEAVVIVASRPQALALARRLKTRFQVPLLPVLALVSRPRRLLHDSTLPDAWVAPSTPPRDVVARVEELVRIRRAERELVRLNTALAELAAENGRLYDRARRDAEGMTLLLRELQHRVRNNLAAIQALLVLERHRTPPRPLEEAIDVAIARLRSMAALQDAMLPSANRVDVAALAHAITRGAIDVFGATDAVRYAITGTATLPQDTASALAVVLNELITNTLKHADARRISIDIRDGSDALEVVVADNGRGMPADVPAGSGLTIARAVVANELRGEMHFVPAELGTRVCIAVPGE
jgi:two-component sensor histidine kinase